MEGRCCNCSPCTGPAAQIRLNRSLCYFCVPFSWFGKARGDEIISPRGKQSIFITPEVSWVPILFLVFFLSCSRQEYDFGSHFLLSPASQKNVIQLPSLVMLYSACVSRPWLNGIPFWEYCQIPDGTCPVRYLDFFEIKRKKRKKMCLAMVLFVNITDGVTCLTLESMHPLNSTVECSYTVENSQ